MDQQAYRTISRVLALYRWGVAGVLRQIWNLVSLRALGPMLAHMCIVEICRVCWHKSGMGVVVDLEEAFQRSPELSSNHRAQMVWVNGVVRDPMSCCHGAHSLWGNGVCGWCVLSALTVHGVATQVGFPQQVLHQGKRRQEYYAWECPSSATCWTWLPGWSHWEKG